MVVPIYNEEESIPLLLEELHAALKPLGKSYELVMVDDGSTDTSVRVLKRAAQSDDTLLVVNFRRNFGQTAAMQAGIDYAQGDVIILMDADLQNDPKDIPMMLEKLGDPDADDAYDVVAGWRADRKDKFLSRRLPSVTANWIIGKTTNVKLHDYGCTLKALRKEVAKEMRLYGEMHRFIPVMASLVGAKILEVKVNHRARQFGVSKYGISRTIRVVLDLITVRFMQQFLVRPMQVFGLGGLTSLFLGILVCSVLAALKIFQGEALAGRPLLLLGVLLIVVGIQLLSLGLIADLLARTYFESQGRPPYYVRHIIRQGQVVADQKSARVHSSATSGETTHG